MTLIDTRIIRTMRAKGFLVLLLGVVGMQATWAQRVSLLPIGSESAVRASLSAEISTIVTELYRETGPGDYSQLVTFTPFTFDSAIGSFEEVARLRLRAFLLSYSITNQVRFRNGYLARVFGYNK